MTAAETAKLLIDAQIKLEDYMRTDPKSPSTLLTLLMLIRRLAAYEDPIDEELLKRGFVKRLAEDC